MPLPPLDSTLLRRVAVPFRTDKKRHQSQDTIMNAIGPVLATAIAVHGMNAPLRTAHFLAQTCHESMEFSQVEEIGDGSEFEGRLDLGNTHPGDGPRYKGRGLIQLTGRTNYRRYSTLPKLDLVSNPELAADPVTSLDLAGRFWNDHRLSELADLDDTLSISFLVNGGFNGIAGRRERLERAKRALGIPAEPRSAMPTLKEGDHGPAVRCLQARLRFVDGITRLDGEYGADTVVSVRQFQSANGLAADGLVGPLTWAALDRATAE